MSPQLFLINPDGTTTEITSEGPIKDSLKTDECYVLVADDKRKVYLWKGIKSSVRSKFIGAKRSQEIRGQVGMHFSVIPLDEGEEDPEFLTLIGGKTEGGIAREIKDEPVTAPSVHPLRDKDTFGPPKPAEGMNIAGSKSRLAQNTGPLYRGDGSTAALIQEEVQVDFQDIMKMVEKVQQFLGDKQVSKEISKVGAIPEGIFFAENYSPRILSENGKILAIEFLKRTGQESEPVAGKTKRELLKEQIKEQLRGS
ncbi:MAG: hypothetical protein ACXADU_03740 [Promethearchaeota archaeon]